jgi:hypothetical protein
MSMASTLDAETIANARESAESAKNSKEDESPDADAILSIMFSGGVEMKKVVLHFRELFKVVALMGGEKPLTTPRMEEMIHKDFRRMMGEYAANFILD